jgi:pantoate--beta-alanine ligase
MNSTCRQVSSIADLRSATAAARARGQSIGLVLTMGALHEGHASLIRRARTRCEFVVVTVFVNPTQFGPKEDFGRYPRTLDQDLDLCRREGVDLVFVSEQAEVYPPGFQTSVRVQEIEQGMEGKSRPGHFQGVATVVLKLFNMVQADVSFFGQKDAQQVRVLQQMVSDLNVPIEIEVVPTVREADGLALSSRNRYLTPEQRKHAAILFHTLEQVRIDILAGETNPETLEREMATRIQRTPGAELDYVAIVDWKDLRPAQKLRGRLLVALAVRFGSTRLIDNVLVTVPITMA